MQNITEAQIESLTELIFDKLIGIPEMGLGEMGECRDEAKRIVHEWIEKENLKII